MDSWRLLHLEELDNGSWWRAECSCCSFVTVTSWGVGLISHQASHLQTHQCGGRGVDLLADGDIEPNPGPRKLGSSLPRLTTGRGSLLSCGDVEPNPGHNPTMWTCRSPPPWTAPVSLDLVFQLRIAVVRTLPGRVLREFSACLALTMDKNIKSPDGHTFFGVPALPRL